MTGGGVGGCEGCRWRGGECSRGGDFGVDALESFPLGECPEKERIITAINTLR